MKRVYGFLFSILLAMPSQAQDVQRVSCDDPNSGLPYIKFCGGQTEVFEFNLETMDSASELAPYISHPFKRKSDTSRMLMRKSIDVSDRAVSAISDFPRPDFGSVLRKSLTSDRIRKALNGRLISRDLIWEVIRDTDFSAHDRLFRQTKDEMPAGAMAYGSIPAPLASIPEDFRSNASAEVTFDIELEGSLDSKNYAPGDTMYAYLYMQQSNSKTPFKSNRIRIIKSDFRTDKNGGMILPVTLKSMKLLQGPNDDGPIQISVIPIPALARYATETADKVKKPNLGKQRLNLLIKRITVQVNYFTK